MPHQRHDIIICRVVPNSFYFFPNVSLFDDLWTGPRGGTTRRDGVPAGPAQRVPLRPGPAWPPAPPGARRGRDVATTAKRQQRGAALLGGAASRAVVSEKRIGRSPPRASSAATILPAPRPSPCLGRAAGSASRRRGVARPVPGREKAQQHCRPACGWMGRIPRRKEGGGGPGRGRNGQSRDSRENGKRPRGPRRALPGSEAHWHSTGTRGKARGQAEGSASVPVKRLPASSGPVILRRTGLAVLSRLARHASRACRWQRWQLALSGRNDRSPLSVSPAPAWRASLANQAKVIPRNGRKPGVA